MALDLNRPSPLILKGVCKWGMHKGMFFLKVTRISVTLTQHVTFIGHENRVHDLFLINTDNTGGPCEYLSSLSMGKKWDGSVPTSRCMITSELKKWESHPNLCTKDNKKGKEKNNPPPKLQGKAIAMIC